MRCPKCGTEYPDSTNFCENDGTPLVADGAFVAPADPAAPAVSATIATPAAMTGCTCGRNEDDGTGYCTGCGMQLAPPPVLVATGDTGMAVTGVILTPPELAPSPALGAVTDRGVRHKTNQDAVAVALEIVDGTPVPVIVVCDGVSSARHSEESSVAAARAACDLLARAAHDLRVVAPPVLLVTDPETDTTPDLPIITPAMLAAADDSGAAAAAELAESDAAIATAAMPIATDGEAETRDLTPDLAAPVAPASFALADPVGAMRAAVIAAHLAVCDIDDTPDPDGNPNLGPPGCTYVAAIVEPHTITIGWVGDCRAYWIAGDESRLLTRDHSYVNDLIDAGQITEEQARTQHANSHVITRCLGPLNGEGRTPPELSVTQIPRPAHGMLLLCSDGMWNYAPEGPHMARLARAASGADAQEISRHLAEYAFAAGGHDNITVAIALLDAPVSRS